MFNRGEGNGKLLLREFCLVYPQESPGVLETQRTSWSSKKNTKEFDVRRNNDKEEMDSRSGTGFRENEDKKIEVTGTANIYVEGNC